MTILAIVTWQKGKKMRLVDLDEVIDAIESTDWYHLFNGKLSEGAEDEDHALYRATDIYKAIGEVPVMDTEPVRHGKWKQWDIYGFEDTYKCTACGESFVLIEGTPITNGYKYCPSCGAKMGDGE